jgi:hypothetical protein
MTDREHSCHGGYRPAQRSARPPRGRLIAEPSCSPRAACPGESRCSTATRWAERAGANRALASQEDFHDPSRGPACAAGHRPFRAHAGPGGRVQQLRQQCRPVQLRRLRLGPGRPAGAGRFRRQQPGVGRADRPVQGHAAASRRRPRGPRSRARRSSSSRPASRRSARRSRSTRPSRRPRPSAGRSASTTSSSTRPTRPA